MSAMTVMLRIDFSRSARSAVASAVGGAVAGGAAAGGAAAGAGADGAESATLELLAVVRAARHG